MSMIRGVRYSCEVHMHDRCEGRRSPLTDDRLSFLVVIGVPSETLGEVRPEAD